MSKAYIRDYGKVEFDPMQPDQNFYDLYDIAICDPETDHVISEEHYTSEDAYHDALYYTYGREVMDEQSYVAFCQLDYDCRTYDIDCMHTVAYVFDHEEA